MAISSTVFSLLLGLEILSYLKFIITFQIYFLPALHMLCNPSGNDFGMWYVKYLLKKSSFSKTDGGRLEAL
jgi:hypothetical protein